MSRLRLPGLGRVSGRSARARRAALLGLSDRELGGAMAELARGLGASIPAEQRSALAESAGLPIGEVMASPFAVRMVASAVRLGATTVPQELRATPRPRGRGARRTDDARHGRWEHGYLLAGKYQQFGLEDPVAVFHPEHTSKWGPHELLHRAVGFHHRADASRFERYVGARLGELLPVVTWYGPEQALRLDEGAFDREAAGRRKDAELRRARWLRAGFTDLDELTLTTAGRLLREGVEHFERELLAIDHELRSGEVRRVEHPFLDASSDALAYVASHAEFLETPACDDVIRRFARPGIEWFEDVSAYRDHVERFFDALLFDAIEVDLEQAARERDARHLWDLALRAARQDPARHARLEGFMSEAGALAARARAGADVELGAARRSLRRCMGRAADEVLASGDARFADGVDRRVLIEGLASSCPTTALAAELDSLVDLLLRDPGLLSRQSLPSRLRTALGDAGEAALADAARLDAAVCAARLRDAAIEELSVPSSRWPRDLARLRFHASSAFEFLVVEHELLDAAHFGEPRRSASFVGRVGDTLAVVPVPEALGPIHAALRRRPTTGDVLVARIATGAGISARRARALLAWLADARLIGARPRALAARADARPRLSEGGRSPC